MNLTIQQIQRNIISLPGRPPFMLVRPLAEVYETEPKQITQAVRRNPDRFPDDFCFELSKEEIGRLQNEAIVSNQHFNGKLFGFSRMGANMLSAVLKTPVAASRSVQIMRAFSTIEERVQTGEDVIGLAVEVGHLKDMVRARDEIIIAKNGAIMGLQGELIGSLRGENKLLKRISGMEKKQARKEIIQAIERMQLAGHTRAEIAAATGKDYNYIRQRVYIARQEGRLPALEQDDGIEY